MYLSPSLNTIIHRNTHTHTHWHKFFAIFASTGRRRRSVVTCLGRNDDNERARRSLVRTEYIILCCYLSHERVRPFPAIVANRIEIFPRFFSLPTGNRFSEAFSPVHSDGRPRRAYINQVPYSCPNVHNSVFGLNARRSPTCLFL